MKNQTKVLSKLLATGAVLAFVAGFGAAANASGDPDSIARKYPTIAKSYEAPAPVYGKQPVKGSGIRHPIGR